MEYEHRVMSVWHGCINMIYSVPTIYTAAMSEEREKGNKMNPIDERDEQICGNV